MEILNPHEVVGTKQYVFWNQLILDKPIELEIIDYFKAKTLRKGRGYYTVYYAIARCNYDDIGIRECDELIFFMTYRSFVNALRKLPITVQRQFSSNDAKGKNLYIKFERVTKDWIKIHNQELREPTQEQLLEAGKQYELINNEHEDTRSIKDTRF